MCRVVGMVLLVGWMCPATCWSESPNVVGAILDRVEARGRSVDDIRCKVAYTVVDRIAADKVTRDGNLIYERKSPNPLFMITFVKTVQEGTVKREKAWYLFDGRWFVEATQRSKSIIKHDVAPPGTDIDLFSVEKAPFPIPFGQKKDDILKSFKVLVGPAGEGRLANTDHLVCIPREGSRVSRDYSKLEFFVSRSLDLPIRIVMTTKDRTKVTTADFLDLSAGSINTGMTDSAFVLPKETRGYAVSKDQ